MKRLHFLQVVFSTLILAFCATTMLADQPKETKKVKEIPEDKIELAIIESQNNLKKILLAIHSYHDANGTFPNNIETKDKILLSWRVAILPFLEDEDAKEVASKFKLDQAWDSDHNKKLLEKMPVVYKSSYLDFDKGHTIYRGFTGKSTIFESGKKIRIASIADGTSNTIGVVEAAETCPWTKPDDLPFDPEKDELPKVGGFMFKDGFNAAFCDGSVQFIKKEIESKTLKCLITRDLGEIVNDFPTKKIREPNR